MTIKECIDIVDNNKPNQYTIKEKVMWLTFLEQIIINEVLKTHEGYDGRYDNFEGYSEDKLSVTMIVPSPYDKLYTEYIKMMIDKENGEIARYNNSMTVYNTYMLEYRKYYNKTHLPLSVLSKKNPAPLSKANIGLSDAEYENLKKDMTYILTEYFSDSVSADKINDVVTKYMQTNAEMFKGKDGKDGTDGKDGYTPVKGIDYTDGADGKPFTFNDLTPAQLSLLKGEKGDKGDKGEQGARGLQGVQGEKGEKGDDGYTPQKSIDYMTKDDEEEISNMAKDKVLADDTFLTLLANKVDTETYNDKMSSIDADIEEIKNNISDLNEYDQQLFNMIDDNLTSIENLKKVDIEHRAGIDGNYQEILALKDDVGNIDTALDGIISIQETLIGGDSE